MLSSQGHVSSIMITAFIEQEYRTISGRRVVTVGNEGTVGAPWKSYKIFHFGAEWSSPTVGFLTFLGFWPLKMIFQISCLVKEHTKTEI